MCVHPYFWRPSIRLSIHGGVIELCKASWRVLWANLRGLRGLRAIRRDLRASWRDLRASQRDLRVSQRGLRACQRNLRACGRGLRASQGGDVWTDERNFSPFYRTLFPIVAASLLPSDTSQHQRSRARQPLTP